MRTPRYPSLYQINTRVWPTELSQPLGRPATLDDIPDGALGRLAGTGFDGVWFLSVWQTGVAAQRVSRSNPEWGRYVRLPLAAPADRTWQLKDVLADVDYERDGNDLLTRGLYLDVPAWHSAINGVSRRPAFRPPGNGSSRRPACRAFIVRRLTASPSPAAIRVDPAAALRGD
jgi:hypothetical protein